MCSAGTWHDCAVTLYDPLREFVGMLLRAQQGDMVAYAVKYYYLKK
jgi:hypothetical protein